MRGRMEGITLGLLERERGWAWDGGEKDVKDLVRARARAGKGWV